MSTKGMNVGSKWRIVGQLALLGALLLLAASGLECGSSDSCTPTYTGLSGTWEVTDSQHSSESECTLVRTYTREIVQSGSHGTIITEWGSLDVRLCGDTFDIPAWTHPLGTGTSYVQWERWKILSPTTAEGENAWRWVDSDGWTCEGTSDLSAVKID